ncbi:hypothetical protein [Dyadobacter sp. NIV53]|uniref:hypothetical protein n=1 Tax=Dyadobacter sp. NIV53 TaxID=2861765 RepID=UPI001C886471|nr:hypothetical protein [Dyadobacter sp. NIV53]
MANEALFKLKEDETSEIRICKDEVEEIIPDADFRFSLVILKNGGKHFVFGTEKEILEQLDGGIL